ncbi:MAG: CPBP family intramembrane metalloprotease [Planctomycetes bacterium]|nr:CPBP family intramembrane metalloprotease [Planctomycetota bacterium]MCP4771499.1 CPBP family intramembrane metalloprotease [Planctomycetota bacterium]MCP4861160.1 CPBP family intramembrane metalloprotease [Planctomycetota bacterium]
MQGKLTPPRVGIDLRHIYSPQQSTLWVVVGLLAVAIDIGLSYSWSAYPYSWTRAIMPVLMWLWVDTRRRKHGGEGWPSRHPNGGWRLWMKVSLIVTGWALLLWLLLFGIGSLFVWGPHFPGIEYDYAVSLLWPVCVIAPLLEEGVYRFLLCTALATRFRHRHVIFISGTLFALLHVAYGNFAPTNLLAGYLLSWAYLMSSSLWLTVLWHGVGNLGILAAQVLMLQFSPA